MYVQGILNLWAIKYHPQKQVLYTITMLIMNKIHNCKSNTIMQNAYGTS